MDKKEFALFAAALKTYYPRETLLPNNQAMELWFRQLQDIPYNIAEASLNLWVATNKWSPSIADIREQASSITEGKKENWGDGWEKVIKAIRYFGMYQEKEALESMDEISRKCVQKIGWQNICTSENINTDRANFRMIFEELSQEKKQQQQIPIQLSQMIEQLQDKLAIERKGD